jgi:protein-L-isoaspartate(D-aspartate) O-methyltransferase
MENTEPRSAELTQVKAMRRHRNLDPSARRAEMTRLIASRGVTAANVLAAMADIPREEFVPSEFVHRAYEDGPLPIGEGQTISQPYIVALMLEALGLEGEERVLDVGTGSGYAAAVAAAIASEVVSIERVAALAEIARHRLHRLEIDNVRVIDGDGTLGWESGAPYDGILVSAGGPDVPPALGRQLVVGGHLVMPIGSGRHDQQLVRHTRLAHDEFKQEFLGAVSFVPLIGAAAWRE